MTGGEGSPAPCRLLRARGAYGPSAADAFGEGWADGGSTLEAYWCLATQQPFGPDDGVVHASRCRAGRACYAAGPGAAGGGGG